MSARVLFCAWPFEGHVLPMMSVALAVRARGGEVAVCTGERLAAVVEGQGVHAFRFDRVGPAWDRVHARQRQARGRLAALRLQREAFRDWLVETVPDQVADVRDVVGAWRPDVVVADGSMWGPSLVLHEADGIPVVHFSTLIYSLVPGAETPLPGARLAPPRSAPGRALARAAAGGVGLAARPVRDRLDELRAGYGLGPMGCAPNAFFARLPLSLIGSVPALDFDRRDLPPSVRYVGPLVWHPPEPPGTAAWLDDVPADAPWVHVTEGTSHHERPFLLRAAAEGLAGAPVEAILTTGRDRDAAALGLASPAPNVHVAGWLSHSELLGRCDVVVTTGGANTVISALRAGVPLVVVPTLWDKPANARRVAAAGAGVELPRRRLTPDRLRAAVEHVLADVRYRRSAERIAAHLRSAPGPAGAAALIERLAPDPGIVRRPPSRSPRQEAGR
jgi:MGT family glycosyltransferase